MDAHDCGFNFIAAAYHPPASPYESIYSSLTWMGVGALMAFPLGFFFSLLRRYNTKYIA